MKHVILQVTIDDDHNIKEVYSLKKEAYVTKLALVKLMKDMVYNTDDKEYMAKEINLCSHLAIEELRNEGKIK